MFGDLSVLETVSRSKSTDSGVALRRFPTVRQRLRGQQLDGHHHRWQELAGGGTCIEREDSALSGNHGSIGR